MNRIPFDEVQQTLAGILSTLGFAADRAQTCARLFAETTRDGVYTHGINRFPRFVATIRNGCVDPAGEAAATARCGALERWDGHKGPGNLNALAAMERAIALGREHGIGCVSMGNTNHWMRAGTYGWQAAEAGMIGICWTNTMPNLPPWGGAERAIGNNPLVIAVPRSSGPVVLDMAMSQFSYGTLESYRKRGEQLPVDGGFDAEGNLTRDPGGDREVLAPAADRLLERLRSLGAARHGGSHDGAGPRHASDRARRRARSRHLADVFGSQSRGIWPAIAGGGNRRRSRCVPAQLPARRRQIARCAIPASKPCASARKICVWVCPSNPLYGLRF